MMVIFTLLLFLQSDKPHELTQTEMPVAIEKQLMTGVEDNGRCRVTYPPGQPDLTFRQQFSVRRVDLDGDGRTEYLVTGTGPCQCSPTGNCSLSIFKVDGVRAISLLDTALVQSFTVRRQRKNGYFIIELYSHGGAFERGVRRFTFDPQKTRYVPTRCWLEISEKDDRVLKKPLIKSEKCQEEDGE